jgi:hypothetical protein
LEPASRRSTARIATLPSLQDFIRAADERLDDYLRRLDEAILRPRHYDCERREAPAASLLSVFLNTLHERMSLVCEPSRTSGSIQSD